MLNKKSNIFLIIAGMFFLQIISNAISINGAILKLDNWHDNKIERKENILINNIGELGLKIVNIPENVNKRASCGNCHSNEKTPIDEKASAPHKKERTILVSTDKTLTMNLLARKNGGRLEFISSEYAKDFSNGPYQAAFVNDGITDSRHNKELGNHPSFWGCDMLTKWKEPFPQEFIYSFKDNKKNIIDSFVLYNGAGGDGDGFDAEVKNFSLYVNSDPITSKDIYNVTDDGGGWSYNNVKFSYLSPNNVLGDGLFPSFQEPDKFGSETWIQSKNLEYTINSNNPKWVRIDFKKPTTISSIFITSDDSANVHNMETDMYKVKIVVLTPTGEKVVYDNSKNQMVEDEFTKGYAAYFDPIEVSGVVVKFYTNRYVEWQKILIFKNPWKKVLSARAAQKYKDYSPETFYFTPVEAQYLRVSVESNYGNPKWVDIGEMEVYNTYPKNLALYENGGRILDCSRVDDYVFGPNRVLDNKLLGDDEYSIQKKDYILGEEFQVLKRKVDDENDIKIILDLNKESVFGQINHYNTGDSGAKNVIIEYSLDNKTWEELGVCEKLNYDERDMPNKDSFVFSPVRARYVKFRYLPKSWVKNKLKISEYEVFEVSPQYYTEGVVITQVHDLGVSSLFEKLVFNDEGAGKIPLNTEIRMTVTTDKVPKFTMERHVSTYIIKPNETATFIPADIHNGDRFIQFKMVMNTKDISTTPYVNNILLEYRTLETVLASAKEYEDGKRFSDAQSIYEKVKAGNYDTEWNLKADQGLIRIKDTINSEATKLFDDGNKLFEKEQYDDAKEIYRSVLLKYANTGINDIVKEKIKESEIGKEFQMAKSLTEKKKYWKAVEQFKAIMDNNPDTIWAKKAKQEIDAFNEMETNDMYDNANRLLSREQFDEAQVLFKQIKDKSSVYKWQQAAQEGIQNCVKGKSEQLYKEAQKFAKNNDLDEAIVTFKKIIREYAESEIAKKAQEELWKTQDKVIENRFNMAMKLKEKKDYYEAMKSFRSLMTESVSSKWKEKFQQEIRDCEDILHQIQVKEAKNLYDQALALEKQEQVDRAYDQFEKIAKDYKNTQWDVEAQKKVDEIKSKRMHAEILKSLQDHNYDEVLVKLEDLKKINQAKELVAQINGKLSGEVEKIYEAGKRYDRDKEYKRAYRVYYFIKSNYPEWFDRIQERLKRVEEKMKE